MVHWQTDSQHILQKFEPTCQKQNTISQMKLFQISVSASELPNLEAQSQSWGSEFGQAEITLCDFLSLCALLAHVAGQA